MDKMNLDEMKQQAREALELAEKATQGPWLQGDRNPPGYFWGGIVSVRDDIMYNGHCVLFEANTNFPGEGETNAEFVSASRTLVPALARAVLELVDEVRHLEIANRESTHMLVEQADEIAQLKRETYCAFCGQRFALDGTAAQLVTEHIQTCEKHPMREVEHKLQIAQAEEMRLRDALDQTRNYIHDDCIQTALEWIDASLSDATP